MKKLFAVNSRLTVPATGTDPTGTTEWLTDPTGHWSKD